MPLLLPRNRDAVTVLSAPRVEPPPSVLGTKRKASGGAAPEAPGQPPWESRRPPPPSAPIAGQAMPTGATSAAPHAPPPPPPRFSQSVQGAAYPAQALPQGYVRAHSRNGEWGDHPTYGSPRTPAFGTSPSTSQGAGSENDSLHLGLFADWEIGFGDPTMTLFPSGSGEDYWQGNGPDPQQPLPPGFTAGYPGQPLADGRYPPAPPVYSHQQQQQQQPPPPMQGGRPSVARPQEYPPPLPNYPPPH